MGLFNKGKKEAPGYSVIAELDYSGKKVIYKVYKGSKYLEYDTYDEKLALKFTWEHARLNKW